MITLKVIAGPFKGRSRQFEGDRNLERGVQIDPNVLLGDLVRNGSRWEIDFSAATPEESLLWGRADMVARIFRALNEGRPVHFMARVYRELEEAGALEDAITSSGQMVGVDRDDEQMLVIIAVGYEEQ